VLPPAAIVTKLLQEWGCGADLRPDAHLLSSMKLFENSIANCMWITKAEFRKLDDLPGHDRCSWIGGIVHIQRFQDFLVRQAHDVACFWIKGVPRQQRILDCHFCTHGCGLWRNIRQLLAFENSRRHSFAQ